MKFVYRAHLDDSLIVLGASVFFILVSYFGAPEKFSLEVSISVVVLYVLLTRWLWFWLLWWMWILGFGCMAVAAWSWLLGCGYFAGSCMLIFSTSQKKYQDMAVDQAAWMWLLGALHGCGCLAGAWRIWQ
jgi:hypothetical protein